jgi:4-hydroxybenzoate polyprenyltransferase
MNSPSTSTGTPTSTSAGTPASKSTSSSTSSSTKKPAIKSSSKLAPRQHVKGIFSELLVQLENYGELMRINKPIGIWLLLWPTLWALWISAKGSPDPWVFTVFIVGVLVTRSAGCVINDYFDRAIDAKVTRTQSRPLPSGRVDPTEALVLFTALMFIAVGLVLTLTRLTQLLAIVGGALIVAYPLCKRYLAAPQLVLGAAFGWGVPMAFAEHAGEVTRLAWLMWLTVMIWALIYDTMYAMADREDDMKIGVNSTAILFGQADVFIISILQGILLFSMLLVGEVADLGMWYRLSILVTALFMLYQHTLIRNREPEKCHQAFVNNHYIGATIFIGIALSYTFSN